MILLLGGTSETAGAAEALARAGYDVLVSNATDIELDVGRHERIQRRTGKLDATALTELVRRQGVRAIVDVTHPYAAEAHKAAEQAALSQGLPCFRLQRLAWLGQARWPHEDDILFADSHEVAAELACRAGRSILLTVGANHVATYARHARQAGASLAARVLDRGESVRACREAGLAEDRIIAARGPFDLEQNRQHIRRFGADVLVTKDSGQAGGLPAKLEAARAEGCRVVVLRRPAETGRYARLFESVEDLVAAVRRIVTI